MLLRDLDLASVDPVANTIFPAQPGGYLCWTRRTRPAVPAMYPVLRRLHKSNRKGTYFGRIVAHPAATASATSSPT